MVNTFIAENWIACEIARLLNAERVRLEWGPPDVSCRGCVEVYEPSGQGVLLVNIGALADKGRVWTIELWCDLLELMAQKGAFHPLTPVLYSCA